MAGFFQSYFEDLVGPARARYTAKVAMCEGVDPYTLRIGKDAIADAELLPSTTYPDIYNYLVLATNYATQEEMRAYKSLDAHNFFTSGFVKGLAATQLPSKRVVVLSEVRKRQMRGCFRSCMRNSGSACLVFVLFFSRCWKLVQETRPRERRA